MKDKLKIGIVVGIVITILLIIALIAVNRNNKATTDQTTNKTNVVERTPISTSRKMARYVDIISKDYYMECKEVDDSGEEVLMEYATLGEKMVIHNENTITTILVTQDASYYILHGEKIILKYAVNPTAQQNLVGIKRGYTQELLAQNFRGTGTEEVKGVGYYYEDYSDNTTENNILRYYFDEDDRLRFIKIISTQDSTEELIEVLELHGNVDETLFELPDGYQEIDASTLESAGQTVAQ